VAFYELPCQLFGIMPLRALSYYQTSLAKLMSSNTKATLLCQFATGTAKQAGQAAGPLSKSVFILKERERHALSLV
jgi:hypothetical protein